MSHQNSFPINNHILKRHNPRLAFNFKREKNALITKLCKSLKEKENKLT